MADKVAGREKHACSFCGRGEPDVHMLIDGRPTLAVGPATATICDECVRLCYEVVTEYFDSKHIIR